MRNVFETIARENFRSSGYIQHPRSERRTAWQFTALPRSPFFTADSVRDALQRRENALHRKQPKTTFLQNCLDVLFHR
jgi:hypothetical protein